MFTYDILIFRFIPSWFGFQDVLNDKFGNVAFVKLVSDEKERPRGCIVGFESKNAATLAIKTMHRTNVKGHKIVAQSYEQGETLEGITHFFWFQLCV